MQTFEDIDVLKKFFWNYNQEDIEHLCKDHRFYHFWNYKRFEYPSPPDFVETYLHLWLGYVDYFPNDMRQTLLDYAKKRFGNSDYNSSNPN